MRTQIPFALLAATLASSVFSVPAHARARVFVASYGNDSNPCTFGSPCKTFQQAVNIVDAGGEVTAIDSAGFGPINITKAVTITSPDGVEAGIVPAVGGDAININAGPTDAVVLLGLTLNGSGIAYNGIVFNPGASLTVTNCVAQNFVTDGTAFTGNGIIIQPTSGTVNFTIINTTAVNNTNRGVFYFPQSGSPNVNGVIDHVVANANLHGIFFYTGSVSGGTTIVTISNSIVSGDNSAGIVLNGVVGTINASIDNVSASADGTGVVALGNVNALLGRSVITGNTTGVLNNTMNTFYTYGDNRINLNAADISGAALNTTFKTQ
jgi:hypothetical protein